MVNHDDAVPCGVRVQFDRIGPALDRQQKPREGVFQPFAWRAAVTDAFELSGSRDHPRCIIPQPRGRQALNNPWSRTSTHRAND